MHSVCEWNEEENFWSNFYIETALWGALFSLTILVIGHRTEFFLIWIESIIIIKFWSENLNIHQSITDQRWVEYHAFQNMIKYCGSVDPVLTRDQLNHFELGIISHVMNLQSPSSLNSVKSIHGKYSGCHTTKAR